MFKPVEIKWQGITYRVPENEVMGLIDTIEDTVTLDELYAMQSTGRIKRLKVSRAYADAINYAVQIMNRDGGDENGDSYNQVSWQDIYNALFEKENAMETMLTTVFGLIGMLLPPEHLKPEESEDDETGEGEGEEKNGKAADS